MKKSILLLISIFLLTSCIPKSSHQINSYDLYIDINPKNNIKSNKVIKVKYPTALGPIGGSKIYYKRDGITSYYLYSIWSSSLTRLIYKDILLALQNSKKYKEVLGYNSSAKADIILETEIIDFYHIVDNNSSYAKITINIKYIDANSKKVIKSQTFTYKKYLKNANAKSFIEGAKTALREFLTKTLK